MLRVFRGKWISVLVMVLLMSLLAPAAWASPGKAKGKPAQVKLRDIKGHWAEQEIEKMGAKGLIQGFEDFSFRPGNEVTHQEVVAMLVRALGLEDEARARAGSQLNLKHKEQLSAWASGYLAVAVETGLVLPGELATIIPKKPAKRGEVAQYLARVLIRAKLSTATDPGTVNFRDANEISKELMAYISPVYVWGLMVGDDRHKFQTNKPVSRAEMAVILARLDALLENGEDDEERITGTLKAVTLGQNPSIKIEKQAGTLVTLPVADEASVYRNNKRATLEELKVGDLVEVVVNADGEAVFIAATAPNVIVTVEGVLRSIDLDDRTIRLILENQSEAVYQLAAGVQVKLNGRTVSLVDLREGDTVKLFLRDGQGIKVEAQRAETRVEGVITSLTLGSDPRIGIRKDHGTSVTYSVYSDAKVELDGRQADLNDLWVGYHVILKLQNGKVSEISAYSSSRVGGTVISITIGATPEITIKTEDGQQATYTVAADAEIEVDGEEAELSDVKPGYQVELKLRDGKIAEIKAESSYEVKGTVVYVVIGTTNKLTVDLESGGRSTYTVAPDARIKVDGKARSFSALEPGYEVELTVRGAVVVRVEAETG